MLINTAQSIVDTEGNRIALGDRFTLFAISGEVVGISLYNQGHNAQLTIECDDGTIRTIPGIAIISHA